jgi:argonaute-like protein implicated in RNA metabolism and viral defense
MEKEFISYEQALDLKELGFDEKCLSRYCAVTEWEELTGEILLQDIDCNVSERFLVKAPLKQQVFRWFREKYRLDSYVRHEAPDVEAYYELVINEDVIDFIYDNYPEAENACIDKLIEIAKEQKKIDLIAEISGW